MILLLPAFFAVRLAVSVGASTSIELCSYLLPRKKADNLHTAE